MQEALQELEHPTTDEEKIDCLIARLQRAETSREREAAATALGDPGRRVLQPVMQALQDENSEVRESAEKILEWLD